jgi:hypothetical protein
MQNVKQFTCKGALRQVFIRVYTMEKQSVMFVFSTQLCELLPPSPSLWFNPPPPLCEICTVYFIHEYTV